MGSPDSRCQNSVLKRKDDPEGGRAPHHCQTSILAGGKDVSAEGHLLPSRKSCLWIEEVTEIVGTDTG